MSRDGKRRRALTQDERVLWTIVTKAITPLRGVTPEPDDNDDNEVVTNSAKAPPKFAGKIRHAASAATAAPIAAPAPKQQPPLATLTRRMKQRVARGKEAIDARIDLHGLTQHEAHGELLRFLRNATARDARLVLVITGKGRGGEIGVLRRQVPQWLALPEFRELVIGYEDAHVAHGGAGALYVRVRRRRGE